jgi:asparagine synthase (glutamine-hydrolysing)
MCGICGSSLDPSGGQVSAMTRAMTHRGPDDEGVVVDDDGFALGARRLSVVDLVHGHQPLANEDGTVWAVLNGEIYNYQALRRQLRRNGHDLRTDCDTEVLVHLYEDHGPELVHALEGMFALAVWDRRLGRLVLARDRFGEKPLFYAERGGELAFASELDVLEAVTGGLALDEAAVDEYFVLGYLPGERTVARGVRQLPPAHVLQWSRGAPAALRRYWRMPVRARSDVRPVAEVEAEAEALVRRAVASRLIADVPVGVFLSGGVDSTLVAAIAAEAAPGRLETFSIGYDVGSVNETGGAAATARVLGTSHHEVVIGLDEVQRSVPPLLAALDQPCADPAFVALALLSRFARERVTVAVGGEGADELFGGYPRYRWLQRAHRLGGRLPDAGARRTAQLITLAAGGTRAGRLADLLSPQDGIERHLDWVTARRRHLRSDLYGERMRDQVTSTAAVEDARSVYDAELLEAPAHRLMALDQQRYLPDGVLCKADRASMLASLELRTPFLERTLAEFSATVPAGTLIAGSGKSLLRAALARVAPALAARRRKVAFRLPLGEWLRGPLAPALLDQADSGRVVTEGWLDRRAYRGLIECHMLGGIRAEAVLWPAFVLGSWLEARPGAA